MFGQPQQQQTTLFGQPQTTFGQPNPTAFGANPATGGGLFGPKPTTSSFATNSSFGAPSTFGAGVSQITPSPQGMFGGNTTFQQNQSNQPIPIGGTSSFGGFQTPGIQQQQIQGGSLGATDFNAGLKNQGGTTSFFGQQATNVQPGIFSQPAFGGTSSFQPTTQTAGGLLGNQFQNQTGQVNAQSQFGGLGGLTLGNQAQQQKTSFFGQPQTQNTGFPIQQQINQGQSTMIYQEHHLYPQLISSNNIKYNQKQILTQDSQPQTLIMTNIRAEDQFSRPSIQMLRFFDIMALKGQQKENFEYIAMQEFQKNYQQYQPFQKLQQVLSLGADQKLGKVTQNQIGQPGFNQQNSFLSGQASQGLNTTLQNQSSTQLSSSLFNGGAQQQSQSGLFGNQNKPLTSASLFAQNQPQSGFNQPPQAIGGNLFTQQQQPQQTIGGGAGLFGNQNQNQPSGLFSQPKNSLTQQPSNSISGGLFNNPSTQQQTGGIFGVPQMSKSPSTQIIQPQISINLGAQTGIGGGFTSQPSNQPENTGIFGNPTSAPNAGTLFQTPNPTTSGASLFPPKPNQVGGNLFGPQSGSTLFQSIPSQQNQQPGGLFNQTPQTGQGGLFSTVQQNQFNQPQQQQQSQQNQINLYENIKDHLGIENSFLKNEHPLENIQKEIEELKKKVQSNFAPSKAARQPVPYDSVSAICGVPGMADTNLQMLFTHNQAYLDEEKRQKAKQDCKQQKILQELQTLRNQQLKKPKAQPLFSSNFKIDSKPSQLQTDLPKPDLSSKSKIEQQQNQFRETVTITCKFEYNEGQVYQKHIEIHKTRLTTQLINKILNWLQEEFRYDGNGEDVNIYFNQNEKLTSEKTLSEVGIVNDCTLRVILKSQDDLLLKETQTKPRETTITQEKINLNQLVLDHELSNEDILPKPPKEGYSCEPNFEQLKKLNSKQLQRISQFIVSNQFGSVQWIGETDITNIDLADVITISQSSCEVYDDERHQRTKPEVGYKLNKPAIITLNNIKPKKNQTTFEKEKFLIKSLENSDASHISYDGLKFSWTFRVEHFTKFGEKDEDDEMDDNAAPSPEVKINSQQKEQDIKKINVVIDNQLLESEMSQDEQSSQSHKHEPFLLNLQPGPQKRFHENVKEPSFSTKVYQVPRLIDDKKLFANPNQENEFSQIINRIEEKSKFQKKLNLIQTERSSNTETINFLKNLGVRKFQKTSLGHRGICKPCFHPSGKGIIFVKANIITVQTLPAVKEFKITDVIQKYLQNTQTDYENQLSQLKLTDSNNNFDQEMADLSTINQVKDQFEDSYFRQFFQIQLRKISNFLSNSHQVYDFLTDLAKCYLKNSQFDQNQKIRYEYYVICLINALFGDPNRQLNAYHKSQKGLDFQPTYFTDQSEINDEQCLKTAKKRRNATLEVFRLLCQLEFPIQKQLNSIEIQKMSEDQICEIVLRYLEVGEIRQAVQLLNRKKLTKLSLIVSQSVSNQFAMSFVSSIQNQFKGGQLKIIEFIQGKALPSESWEINFLYSLMYKQCHTIQLREIVNQYEKLGSLKKVESLLWKLLRVYAQVIESDKQIEEMRGQLIPNLDPRDFRIRWITQIVLKSALFHLKRDQQIKWICVVHDDVLTATASNYVNQLLNQNEVIQACQVALLITNQQIRKRLFFEILLHQVYTDKGENKEIQDFCQYLQIPDVFIKTAAAIRLQSNGKQTSQAVSLWIDCNNLIQAEQLLSRMVLPNHLNTSSDLSQIKSYYSSSQLLKDQQQIQNNRQNFIDGTLSKLKKKFNEHNHDDWNATLCGVFQIVQDQKRAFVETLVKSNSTQEMNQIYHTLTRINQKLYTDQQKIKNDPVIQFLRKDIYEIIMAIRCRSFIDTALSTLSTEGIQRAQAIRCCETSMMCAHAELRNVELN